MRSAEARALAQCSINNLRGSKNITHLNHITLSTDKQDTNTAEDITLTALSNKTDIEPKSNTNLLRCKKSLKLATFNVRTLKTIGQHLTLEH